MPNEMSEELKPCPFCGSENVKLFYDERQNYHVECYGCNKTVSFHIADKSSQAKAVKIYNRRVQPDNPPQEPYGENENFIQTKFGYCFYSLDDCPFIYNLYVCPQYRRCGHSRMLLGLVINEIRKSGYEGEIRIQAKPREDSISLVDLTRYYKSMGLVIYKVRKPEDGEKA